MGKVRTEQVKRIARELLNKLITDKKFYDMVVKKARKNVEKYFSASSCAEQVIKVLESLK